ncbi:hypothetical protein [Acidithiobacillus ferridurans]|uniref:Uncharacterized protein n=1 Tax=Acidithiobacillus ferridurans TaxID=1232575 RepID=A0A8X8GFZ1_ACIFI|nr:hypothetical protein [Acidithiobacillus ferridurans]MBU2715112.1 hypothetical protein [Acidithiobacillus ferridurans]MBU2724891.1 hypothetical protein [Acidithiobacillus ferridurans]MBU2728150.1 hypothetical protein [Acidithiobacillus ferridurans]
MISKETHAFIMNRLETAKQAELLVIKDELQELLRSPICAGDKKLWKDTKKLIKKINEEIDARYDLYLAEKLRTQPKSASVVPLRQTGSGV